MASLTTTANKSANRTPLRGAGCLYREEDFFAVSAGTEVLRATGLATTRNFEIRK